MKQISKEHRTRISKPFFLRICVAFVASVARQRLADKPKFVEHFVAAKKVDS